MLGINDLLPSGLYVKKILSGSELLLAYELDKYAKLMLGERVSLSDVTIARELLSGDHFSFVVDNGLDVGFDTSGMELSNYGGRLRLFFTETVEGVEFESESLEEIVYSFNHNIQANMVLHKDNRSAGYVSLVAYIIVKSIRDGRPVPRLRINHKNYNHRENEYNDLFILKLYGNRLLENLVEIEYGTGWDQQPEWVAFVEYNRQLGYMNREYTITEKYKYLSKNFEIGDVVLLYRRGKPSRGKTITKLEECKLAVIRGYDKRSVTLSVYPTVKTRLTVHMEYENVNRLLEESGKSPLYRDVDFDRFTEHIIRYDYTSIGIDKYSFVERDFILEPLDYDGSVQWLKTKDGMDRVWLSTLDTIYTVFEDRGVSYNKENFLRKYFKNRVPVYEQYRMALGR